MSHSDATISPELLVRMRKLAGKLSGQIDEGDALSACAKR